MIGFAKKCGQTFLRGIDLLCDLGHFLGEVGVFLLLVIVFYAVVMRYIFNSPPLWTDEITPYIFIFIIWIPMGGVLKQNRHITLDIIVANAPPRMEFFLKKVAFLVGLIFCSILFWYSAKHIIFLYNNNFRSSTLLEIPYWIPFIPIPVGSFLISLQFLVKIAYPFRNSSSTVVN